MSARTDHDSFPAGLNQAFLFSVFNALSFQIVLSSPMVLYAKTLHASATVLGIITGMMPLLVILQIPAASYINRIGYKRFVLGGWSARVMFVFLIALVPVTSGFLNEGSRLALVLALLFGFNFSRGISSCAWLPWISLLVPASVRGRYLSGEQACVNAASFLSFVLAAVCLGGEPRSWQFAALFTFSAVMGAVSLYFLKRIPDVPVPEEPRTSTTQVPWLAMARFPPFMKLMRAVVGWSIAYGGMQTFTVAFLKSEAGMGDGTILFVSSISFLGGLCSLWFLGSRLDRLGSKPVLTFCFATWLLLLAGWTLLAGRVLAPGFATVLALQFFMGLLAALAQMSNTRLAMAIVPQMGRNHFFALFSVIGSVAMGISPIAWGVLIDAVGRGHVVALGLDWNRFTVFFVAVAAVMAVALALARKLEEPEAVSMDALMREILIQSPQRFLVRFWPRG